MLVTVGQVASPQSGALRRLALLRVDDHRLRTSCGSRESSESLKETRLHLEDTISPKIITVLTRYRPVVLELI